MSLWRTNLMASDQTSLPLPPPAPVTASEPAAAPVTMESAPAPTGTAIPSLKDKIAGIVAAGEAATKATAADVTAPAAAPGADPVADIPEPPAPAQVSEPAKADAPVADPIAALEARFMAAMEKQNATLLEQLAKLTAQPAAVPAPAPVTEPEKPAAAPADRTIPDSPYEAQARIYFGDLPKPLLTQATEAFERRHGWQLELKAAGDAAQAGDAAARTRVAEAQTALAKVQTALDRIAFDAQLAAQANAKPQPAPQTWGVLAREEVVDAALSDRAAWNPTYQALEDHEVAAVLRAVPVGKSIEDYSARATQALDAYVAKKQGSKPAPATAAAKPLPTTQPKNPAPPAPAKPEVTVSGDPWANDKIPSKHEKMQRILSRARGDAMTN
jgi:hypothetical protein